jgi:hypothetical protein
MFVARNSRWLAGIFIETLAQAGDAVGFLKAVALHRREDESKV